MADHLLLRGFHHSSEHTGTDFVIHKPTNGRSHFSYPRWWNRSGSTVYVSCVKVELQGQGWLLIAGKRDLKLELDWDDTGKVLTLDLHKNMQGVERIKVAKELTSGDYDDYSVNGLGRLVKKQVGSGFTPAGKTAPPLHRLVLADRGHGTIAGVTIEITDSPSHTPDDHVSVKVSGTAAKALTLHLSIADSTLAPGSNKTIAIAKGDTAVAIATALAAQGAHNVLTTKRTAGTVTWIPSTGEYCKGLQILIEDA